jgi:hypothetical protein
LNTWSPCAEPPAWQRRAGFRYNPRPVSAAVPHSMEINPSLNRIKDLTERSQSLRGYL